MLDVMLIIGRFGFHRLPVISDAGDLTNIITQSAVVKQLVDAQDEVKALTTKTLSELGLDTKQNVVSVDSDASLKEAIQLLRDHVRFACGDGSEAQRRGSASGQGVQGSVWEKGKGEAGRIGLGRARGRGIFELDANADAPALLNLVPPFSRAAHERASRAGRRPCRHWQHLCPRPPQPDYRLAPLSLARQAREVGLGLVGRRTPLENETGALRTRLPSDRYFIAATSEVEHEAMSPAITCKPSDTLERVMRQVNGTGAKGRAVVRSVAESAAEQIARLAPTPSLVTRKRAVAFRPG